MARTQLTAKGKAIFVAFGLLVIPTTLVVDYGCTRTTTNVVGRPNQIVETPIEIARSPDGWRKVHFPKLNVSLACFANPVSERRASIVVAGRPGVGDFSVYRIQDRNLEVILAGYWRNRSEFAPLNYDDLYGQIKQDHPDNRDLTDLPWQVGGETGRIITFTYMDKGSLKKSVTAVIWNRSVEYHLESIVPQDDRGAGNQALERLIQSVAIGS